jgi:hypothetical protein
MGHLWLIIVIVTTGGGRDQEDHGWRQTWKIVCKTLSQKYPTWKRAGGVAQAIEHLTSVSPWVQTTVLEKKNKAFQKRDTFQLCVSDSLKPTNSWEHLAFLKYPVFEESFFPNFPLTTIGPFQHLLVDFCFLCSLPIAHALQNLFDLLTEHNLPRQSHKFLWLSIPSIHWWLPDI